MKKILFFFVIVLFLSGAQGTAQVEHNCFSVLVGKNATIDGSVLFAHNEDDYGKQLVNWIAVPRTQYHEGSELILKDGGRVGQPSFTNRYVWLEIPGMDFSDSYLNEFGVCIGSNSCSSREDQASITDGGIGYNLRQIMAEKATTAREAVIIAGRLIEQFGYTGSGRTYCIADPNEAWVIAVVKGKHWVAQRVPDDQVMVLPNNYTIREVNLSDQQNFLSCPDLIDYAVKRGWYKPDSDGPFNFRNVYAGRNSIKHPGNVNRAWGAYRLFNTGYAITDDFPFSFKPGAKVSKQDLMKVLRDHYENSGLDKTEGYTKGSPYKMNGATICAIGSVYGFVAELRPWIPVDIGCVMWLAPQWPDIQSFIPLYAGVTGFPSAYCRPGYLASPTDKPLLNPSHPSYPTASSPSSHPVSLSDHYNPPANIHERNNQHAFWAYVEFSELMNDNYGKNIESVRKSNLKSERKMLAIQPALEKKLVAIYEKSPDHARATVTSLYESLSMKALAATRKYIKRLK